MPSRTGEGIHRVLFHVTLACGYVVHYSVRPHKKDFVYCTRHNHGTTLREIRRVETLTTTLTRVV